MGKSKTILLVAVVIIGVALFRQQINIWRLEKERAQLAEHIARLTAAQDQNARLSRAQVDPAELARRHAEQAELLRLRSEVAQLRRQAKAAAAQTNAAVQASAATNSQEAAFVPPVEEFAASNHVSLAWKQTLVTGGWSTEPGKRTLFFVQPEPLASTNADKLEILVKVQVLEMPDEVLTSTGLEALKFENKESSPQAVFSPEQSEALLKQLKATEGVKVVSSPRIQTSHGIQASLHIGSSLSLPSGETYPIGTSMDVLPELSPDHSSVLLTVGSQIRKPKS